MKNGPPRREPVIEPAGALGLKVAIEVAKRVPTSGLARVRDYFTGKQLLVVGPPRSGKTSFVWYLRSGTLLDEATTEKTQRLEPTRWFRIRMGRDASVEFRIRRVFDAPGQISAEAQANHAVEKKPDGIVMVTDLGVPFAGKREDATANWIRKFFVHANDQWERKNPRKNPLRVLIVLLNKVDKVPKKAVRARQKDVERLLEDCKGAATVRIPSMPILPTILVTNPAGPKSAENAVITLAKSLVR